MRLSSWQRVPSVVIALGLGASFVHVRELPMKVALAVIGWWDGVAPAGSSAAPDRWDWALVAVLGMKLAVLVVVILPMLDEHDEHDEAIAP